MVRWGLKTSELVFDAERLSRIQEEVEALLYDHWQEVKLYDDMPLEVDWERLVRDIKRKLQDMGYTLLDPLKWYLDEIPATDGA